MAEVLINDASFPGVGDVLEASYTCGHGASPGQATVVVPPDLSRLKEVGDLRLSDGVRTLTLKDCKVVRPSGQVDGSGQRVTLLLHDRRWKWEFPTIDGRYNQLEEQTQDVPLIDKTRPAANQPGGPPPPPKGDEPVKPRSRKTLRELATLCLKAMGEKKYNVQALDPSATPTVDWDRANAARALQQLAEDHGCRVVFRPVQNDVVIVKLGDGKPLPGGAVLTDNPSLEAKPRPDRIILYGARTKVQMKFALEAVGKDFDGSIKPIDKLSYTPTDAMGGWAKSVPPNFANVPSDGLPGIRTRSDAVALAQTWVFRAYRIKPTYPNGLGKLYVPPNRKDKKALKRIDQIRLLPFQCETARDDLGGGVTLPAQVFGRHTPLTVVQVGNAWLTAYDRTDDTTEVQSKFTIDADHQMIVFEKYVVSWRDGGVYPAEIALLTACEFTDNTTDQYERWSRELKLSGALGGGAAAIIREDVEYQILGEYQGNELTGQTDNRKVVEKRADYYLRGEARRYEAVEAEDVAYPGVRPEITPDGAIHQVTWSIGGQGPTTRASRNSEHALYLPSYDARRRIEETRLEELRRLRVQRKGL